MTGSILIENARENNLRNLNITLPHYRLIAVCGVSGSGKSSLIADVLQKEGHRLFIENFLEGNARQQRNPGRPAADRIEGLFPVIALNQQNYIRSSRSTVGTMTGIYDYLRLLYARLGTSPTPNLIINRSLFSFNHPAGYCPLCKGVGLEDHIDTAKIIGDSNKTIREGAINLMTPTGYIIYSQVTMEELNKVCVAEGFDVDIPWKDLSEAQRNVVFYGSEKVKILFGKHTLESRLKWTGITARPREEGFYKGIVPVMEEILKRDRNPNILRFSKSVQCSACQGKKLNADALGVELWGHHICDLSAMEFSDLQEYLSHVPVQPGQQAVAVPVIEAIQRRLTTLCRLGLGYLNCDREAPGLSNGEAGRIRLAAYASSGLRNILYIFDEPSAGLHPLEHGHLMDVLKSLVQNGNTVIVADHNRQTLQQADWIVDMGPGAGTQGGEILFNGPASQYYSAAIPGSQTQSFLQNFPVIAPRFRTSATEWQAGPLQKHNLNKLAINIQLNAINTITGLSGSGKTSLLEAILDQCTQSDNPHPFRKVIPIDSRPIGRTPRSNPATYTGLGDVLRDLLAAQPEAKARGYKKGRFSFAVPGGRCEACGGAGIQQVGMHFLGNVDVVCDQCNGKRFSDETLEIRYRGKNIYDMLELTFEEAQAFFADVPKIGTFTQIINDLGLGYLKMGQSSTSLSGGEAQRIKLATELARAGSSGTLYLLDEPGSGLHYADMNVLFSALEKLAARGHTLICSENDPFFILHSDHVIDLGPGSGKSGGRVVFEGPPHDLLRKSEGATAQGLQLYLHGSPAQDTTSQGVNERALQPLTLSDVTTNNLQHISVSFTPNEITAVGGVSGAGKSSLVYATLYAECHRLFLENNSAHIRQYSNFPGGARLGQASGLMPAIALRKKNPVRNPRSVIAGYTGLYELYRLLFSRLAKGSDPSQLPPLSTHFSFNREDGACPHCAGLGTITRCDPEKLVSHPERPLIDGAMDGSKAGTFYGEPHGQYVATLLAAGAKYHVDFSIPYIELDDTARHLAMYGCGDEIFEVNWAYKRGNTEGVHHLKRGWPGFTGLVNEEYSRKHADARGEAMLSLMTTETCPVCNGYRLKPEILQYRLGGLHIGELTAMSAEEALDWFEQTFPQLFTNPLDIKVAERIAGGLLERLHALCKAGLGYLGTNRLVSTLSGGEYQRLQMAGLVRAPLTGTLYILDEPSFGLHPKDIQRISDLVRALKAGGNTVIMIDHSTRLIQEADRALLLGPGAGANGGKIIDDGSPADLIKNYFAYEKIALPARPDGGGLQVQQAFANNLKQVDFTLRSKRLTVLTGVSGSGKSSLLQQVIYESLLHHRPVACKAIHGFEHFSECIFIEQSIPQPSASATVGSYLNLNTAVQQIFAATPDARTKKWKAAHFSRQSRDGQCPDCEGSGERVVVLDFMPDAATPCETCNGSGFKDEILSIIADGKCINEVELLDSKALKEFLQKHLTGKKFDEVHRIFDYLEMTGLSYLSSGRFLKTLSGGELQRLKLVKALSRKLSDSSLIIMDEPGAGLHATDIDRLLRLFAHLLDQGHTLLCATHEPQLMEAAHDLVELGPGGGKYGGEIVAHRQA